MTAARPAEPDAAEGCASPLLITVHGQRDLGERRLLDEVAARILGEIAGAAAQLDRSGLRLEQAAAIRASVVLPDPFGPPSETISPRRTSRSTPSRTGIASR